MRIIIIIKKDIAHINFTLRYLQLYLLFSCIAGPDFAFFLGGKFSSSFTSLDNILWSKTLLSKQISLVESRTYASGWTNNVTAG